MTSPISTEPKTARAPARRVELALVIAVVVVTAFYARAESIPTWADRRLEVAAQTWNLPVADAGAWFSAWSQGDGQAFAVIASDPFGEEFGETLKEPGYRMSRAGYAWATAVVAMGDHSRIPYALAIVGGLSVIGVLALAIRLRQPLGPRAWILVVNPALYIGFAGDTAEPMALALLIAAMMSSSIWAAAILGVTRPTYLVTVINRFRLLIWGVLSALVLAIFSIWRFGLEGLVPDDGRLGFPLRGFVEYPSWPGGLLLFLATITLLVGWRERRWAWVLGSVFIICFGADVFRASENAWRAAGFLPVLWAFADYTDEPGSESRLKTDSSDGISRR